MNEWGTKWMNGELSERKVDEYHCLRADDEAARGEPIGVARMGSDGRWRRGKASSGRKDHYRRVRSARACRDLILLTAGHWAL